MWMCKKCETYNKDSEQKCFICFTHKDEFDDENVSDKKNTYDLKPEAVNPIPLNMKSHDIMPELAEKDLKIFSDTHDFDIVTNNINTRLSVTRNEKNLISKIKEHKYKLIFIIVILVISIIIYLMYLESEVIFDFLN